MARFPRAAWSPVDLAQGGPRRDLLYVDEPVRRRGALRRRRRDVRYACLAASRGSGGGVRSVEGGVSGEGLALECVAADHPERPQRFREFSTSISRGIVVFRPWPRGSCG